MALSTTKTVAIFLVILACIVFVNIVRQSSMLNTNSKVVRGYYYSPQEEAFTKWERCKRLISGQDTLTKTGTSRNDSEILGIYRLDQDCSRILQTRYVHPPVSKEEERLPIAFGLTVHKGACLLERLLRAIYMPNNVYCIHIDKKASAVFRTAIMAIKRCLPNVIVAENSLDVTWGHITIVEAQFSCMEELLKSPVEWKYYISLVAQDFPLYDNKQIVRALQRLNNTNNIGSSPMHEYFSHRINFVHILNGHAILKTKIPKAPPPHNISIFKGSTHIVALREFVDFALHSQIANDFYEYLKKTLIPDETIYASLQQLPGAPGGIKGNQPKRIQRAMLWKDSRRPLQDCGGMWKRDICWISIKSLRWALGEYNKEKLFVHKIPFDFKEELVECILVARQGRKYATALWNEEENVRSKKTN